MDPDALKIRTLSIAVAGLLILLTGLVLYLTRAQISDNVRFFVPIPPLGVAAYIFVFNMYNQYGGKLPEGHLSVVREIVVSTSVAAIAFGIFTLLIIGAISIIET